MSPRRPSAARADDEASKRRNRNRLSQRHFRERQSNYIKQLELRVEVASLDESERNSALVQENSELRSATLKLRLDISKIASALETVSTEIGRILDVAEKKRNETSSHGGIEPVSLSPTRRAETEQSAGEEDEQEDQPLATATTHAAAHTTGHDALLSYPTWSSPILAALDQHFDNQPSSDEIIANNVPGRVPTQVPGHGDEMTCPTRQFDASLFYPESSHPDFNVGDENGNAWDITPPTSGLVLQAQHIILPPGHFPPSLAEGTHSQFARVSIFSQHIELLERQARCKLDIAPDRWTRNKLDRCCSTILSTFVGNAWPHTWSVWFKSQAPSIIVPILSWRINPSMESWSSMLPEYKPTSLQLREPHSAIIDWVPYAPLRDRIIMFYNGSAELDRLLCDMLNSYVVEVEDLSRVLPHAPSGRGYLGIWNLFSALDAVATNGHIIRADPSADTAVQNFFWDELNPHLSTCLPNGNTFGGTGLELGMSKLTDVLTSPRQVAALSHQIRLDQAKTWRLDRTLFEKWPELKFVGYEEIVARGRSCRLPTDAPRAPIEITAPIMQTYQQALQDLA